MASYLIITGGSRGIGKAAIELFKKDNWEVINISRTACDIPGVRNFNIDLCEPGAIQQHRAQLISAVTNADKICLVHNASLFKIDDIKTMSDDGFRETLECNLVSVSALNTIFIPSMRPGSAIIYIGSTLSEMARPERASYIITKHALIGMMRASCQDLAGMNITTCCICPGFVDTTMLTGQADKATIDAIIKSKVSAGRLIKPEEIASLIHYCATNPVVNGSVLHANLGQLTT